MDEKICIATKLNIKFDYDDLHEILKEALPEEIWILMI